MPSYSYHDSQSLILVPGWTVIILGHIGTLYASLCHGTGKVGKRKRKRRRRGGEVQLAVDNGWTSCAVGSEGLPCTQQEGNSNCERGSEGLIRFSNKP